MADAFADLSSGLNSPASKLLAVTPHDSTNLTTSSRGLWIGTGGNVAILAVGDSAAVTLLNVPGGTLLPIRATRVNATGTTATDIVALI